MNRRFKPGDRVIIRAGAQIGFGFLGLSSEMAAIRDARSVGIVLNYSNGIQDYTVSITATEYRITRCSSKAIPARGVA